MYHRIFGSPDIASHLVKNGTSWKDDVKYLKAAEHAGLSKRDVNLAPTKKKIARHILHNRKTGLDHLDSDTSGFNIQYLEEINAMPPNSLDSWDFEYLLDDTPFIVGDMLREGHMWAVHKILSLWASIMRKQRIVAESITISKLSTAILKKYGDLIKSTGWKPNDIANINYIVKRIAKEDFELTQTSPESETNTGKILAKIILKAFLKRGVISEHEYRAKMKKRQDLHPANRIGYNGKSVLSHAVRRGDLNKVREYIQTNAYVDADALHAAEENIRYKMEHPWSMDAHDDKVNADMCKLLGCEHLFTSVKAQKEQQEQSRKQYGNNRRIQRERDPGYITLSDFEDSDSDSESDSDSGSDSDNH
jgi:hypothetical protein